MAQAAYDNLANADPGQIAISPQMQQYIQQDPSVMYLNNTIMGLEQQKMILGTKFGENHRVIRELNRQLEAYTQELDRVLQEKEGEIRAFQISTAQTEYLNMVQAELAMRERVLEAEYKQRDLDEGIEKYKGLEDEQRLLEDNYYQIRGYINQLLLVMSDTRSQVRVQLMQDAEPAELPYFPKYEYNVPAGVFLGILLACGVALLLELIDTSIRTPKDIVRHARVPILGTVPDMDDEEIPIDQIELAMQTAPRSMTAEAFRTVRTNLLLSSPSERQRSVLVTSAKPEEGRTTVAINLAIALAQSGRRVLLVDANFHRPRLPEFFPKIGKKGFSNVLLGQVELDSVITSTDMANLDVLGTGPIPPNPTELLTGSYLQDMVTRAAGLYDQVIFDGPPVLLVTDALVMASAVDGLIIVCRAKETSRGVMLRASEHLDQVNARVFGAVLNAARVRRGGYFREQIRTFYDYQPEEDMLTADSAQQALPSPARDDDHDTTEDPKGTAAGAKDESAAGKGTKADPGDALDDDVEDVLDMSKDLLEDDLLDESDDDIDDLRDLLKDDDDDKD
jgi:capsular exopolysaccharide synthesis family protein